MAGTEAIINKIIADAKAKAEQILEQAKVDSQAVLDSAVTECEQNTKACMSKKQAVIDETIARRRTVAELDVKKIVLKAKKDAIDKAFDLAKEDLVNLSSADYLKLVSSMIETYVEDGDIVTISSKDKDIITDKLVKDIASKKGVKLTLSKEYGDFTGGVILSNNGIDKNLTFDVELKVLREELETTIASMIFDKESK